MCGVFGILIASNIHASVAQHIVDALTVLQHRGQDAAGLICSDEDGHLNLRKDNGLVSEVFTQKTVGNLLGNIGIGHVRYPTAGRRGRGRGVSSSNNAVVGSGGGGGCGRAEAQPFYVNSPFGIAITHNGNLTNTDDLLASMRAEFRHINTASDSELLLNVFAEELQRSIKKAPPSRSEMMPEPDEIFSAVRGVMARCRGGFSVIILINRVGLLAFRDQNGIRPLCFGSRRIVEGEGGEAASTSDFVIASESCQTTTS